MTSRDESSRRYRRRRLLVYRTGVWSVPSRLSPAAFCKTLDLTESSTVLPISPDGPSHACPTLKPAPKEEVGWGLVPLFHSVRSKLESFAEIFLTPVKSRKDAQSLENGTHTGAANQPACSISGEVPRGPALPSALSPAHSRVETECGLNDVYSASSHGDNMTHNRPSPSQPQRTPPDPMPPSTLCRPPLQRYLSCPLPSPAKQKRRQSLDTMDCTVEPCACRRRRHSLGSLDECHSLIPFPLSCLRKENHPSVLRLALCLPGDVRSSVHSEGSPASRYLDKDRVQGLSGAEHQVTADSAFKSPESRSPSKENKVSNIQIRKRTQRPEEKLTPLGLPKRVRLQKEDFSLEEIYTNKNYHTPTEKRKFETIFEEPMTRDGALILTSQRPLRRIMVFKDRTSAPRKRKRKGKVVGRTRRHPAASTADSVNYELLLQHKLQQLEAALQEDSADP
ncbi:proline-rich protein 14 isoform X2 [Dendrobates tinctorius]|uniref:proline-rich protein 14 isoform X2 n=1 Tax=Dendrobates tinctorius TaxID=92724 RepID=UPI003CC96708